jgi:hypothetical protein
LNHFGQRIDFIDLFEKHGAFDIRLFPGDIVDALGRKVAADIGVGESGEHSHFDPNGRLLWSLARRFDSVTQVIDAGASPG